MQYIIGIGVILAVFTIISCIACCRVASKADEQNGIMRDDGSIDEEEE